jgi:hypothetical protein
MYRVLSPSELRRMGFIQCVDCKRWLEPQDFLHVQKVDLVKHIHQPLKRKCVYCLAGENHADR